MPISRIVKKTLKYEIQQGSSSESAFLLSSRQDRYRDRMGHTGKPGIRASLRSRSLFRGIRRGPTVASAAMGSIPRLFRHRLPLRLSVRLSERASVFAWKIWPPSAEQVEAYNREQREEKKLDLLVEMDWNQKFIYEKLDEVSALQQKNTSLKSEFDKLS